MRSAMTNWTFSASLKHKRDLGKGVFPTESEYESLENLLHCIVLHFRTSRETSFEGSGK